MSAAKIKRYLLFEYSRYYPQGGMQDFLGYYHTKKEVRKAIKDRPNDWGYLMQVYDLLKNKIVLKIESRGRYYKR